MRKIILPIFIGFVLFTFKFSCSKRKIETPQINSNRSLVDTLATPETVALFNNLQTKTKDKFLFGHQESLAYGIGWKSDGTASQSDIKEVCGDFPAVYGWDIGDIGQAKGTNVDGVLFDEIKSLIKIAYKRGGINTISMHLDNPVTGGNAWDNSAAVSQILPGGANHENYLQTLDHVAAFMKDLKAEDGTYIPIILRPYHEHNQKWPWWGVETCSEREFIALWKMTIDYLKNDHNIHHLLYAISPQDINSSSQYFQRYPGDEYVDVLGMDNWRWSYNPDYVPFLSDALDMLGKEAERRGKIAALTEVGLEKVGISNWWTDYLLKALNFSEDSKKVAWALVWRNADTTHYYAPFPGQVSAPNFVEFYQDTTTCFENDLPDMYVE